MKENMKRLMAIVLCMVQLFACLPQGRGHAHAEETCTHPNAEHTNTYYSLSEGGTWTDNGDGTHSGLSQLVNWWYCFECGNGWAEYMTEPAMNTEAHSYEDGVCACGATETTTACEHLTTTGGKGHTWVEGESEIKQYNGQYHIQTMQPVIMKICADCGESWNDPVSGVLVDVKFEHEFDEQNTCTVCGYVDTCDHAETTTVREYSEPVEYYGYTITEESHTFTQHNSEYTVCADCGKEIVSYGTVVGTKKVTEDHQFTEAGVCYICDYVKETHLHTVGSQTGAYQEQLGSVQLSETHHVRLFNVHGEYECSGCGETYSAFIEAGSETEEHVFVTDESGVTACNLCGFEKPACTDGHTLTDGVCSACGYCQHTQGGSFLGSVTTQSPAEMADDQFHKVVNTINRKYACSACGDTYLTITELDLFYAHDYDESGVCVCGAEGATSTCEHLEVLSRFGEENVVYSNVTDTSHLKDYDYYYYDQCVACGMDVYGELIHYSRTQDHTLEGGVCVCGYGQAACEHDETETYLTYYSLQYEQLDETGHYEVYKQASRTVCLNEACGKELAFEDTGVTVSLQCAHVFADGVCSECSYAATGCMHVNATVASKEQELAYGQWTDNGDGTHSGMVVLVNMMSCPDCEVSYKDTTTVPYMRTASHTRGEDGLCPSCSAEVAPCQTHDYVDGVCVVCGATETACTEHSYEWSDYASVDGTPVYMDEQFHLLPYTVNNTYVCSVCGDSYVESTDYEANKAHEYDENGLCACGAEGEPTTCAHTNKERRDYEANVVYSDVTESGHTKTYDYYSYTWCLDCSSCRTYQLVDQGRTVAQEHTLTDGVCACGYGQAACEEHTWVDGKCSVCGAENPCEHSNGEQTGGRQENKVFTRLDETQHVYTFDVYWDYECPDCNEAYSVFIEQGFEYDDHAYIYDPNLTACNLCGAVKPCEEHTAGDNGVCSVCGDCAHRSYSYDSHVGMDFHDPVYQDEQFHVQPYTSYIRYLCNTCSAYFIKTSAMEGEEAHTFDENGLCACGAEGETTTCAHANIEWGEREYAVYSDLTLTQHTEKADIYWCGWCPDCETIRQRQLDAPGTATAEDHSYVGGTCSECGHHYLTGLTSVYELPADLVEVEPEAFMGSTVEAVIVPDGCQKLSPAAFLNCAQLKVIVVPESVIYLYTDTFSGCPDVVVFAANPSAAQAYCEANGIAWLGVEF